MAEAAKSSRVEDAYERLKDEIRTNRMPPGFQAPEPEIALRLGMSRTPVREALIRLEAEGLVELIPRRGARVLPIQPEDMREIYEILTALEPDAAARLASRKPSKEELAPLAQATRDMEEALRKEDLDAWAEADDRFHVALLELQGNRRLKNLSWHFTTRRIVRALSQFGCGICRVNLPKNTARSWNICAAVMHVQRGGFSKNTAAALPKSCLVFLKNTNWVNSNCRGSEYDGEVASCLASGGWHRG